MGRLARNRCVPVALTFGNMAFWLCLRDISAVVGKYPFFSFVYQVGVQLSAFLVMGVTLAWALFACAPNERRGLRCLKAAGSTAVFVLYQQGYNLLLRRRIYGVSPWVELAGICVGVFLAECLLARWGGEPDASAEEQRISLESISRFRSQLMGVAMLWVLLLHMDVDCPFPLNVIKRLGNCGVDIFLFVSGIGMVYSLSKRTGLLAFYRRRARRIFPEAMLYIGIYGLICVCSGYYGIPMMVADCLGMGFWLSAKGFNWYYSFILMIYLVVPLMYRLLCGERTRYVWAIAMSAASMVLLFLLNDAAGMVRIQIAFARVSTFVIGMLAGFWLKEGKDLSRGEYRSLFPLCAVFFLLAYAMDMFELYTIIGSMWLCYCVSVPAFCLMVSRWFSRLRDGRMMRFLKWVGENSLFLYIWNMILLREQTAIIPVTPTTNLQRLLIASVMVGLNFLVVILTQTVKKRVFRRGAA